MQVQLTQLGMTQWRKYLGKIPNAKVKYDSNPQPNKYTPDTECFFVCRYSEKDANGDTIWTPYHCSEGSPIINIDDDHYSKSDNLQKFVDKGILEVVSL